MPVMNVTLGDLNYTLGIGAENAFLRLAGNLAGTNAGKLSAVFQRTITHARGKLFVSLQGCYSIDSQVLAALALHHKNLADRCREIILVEVPAQVLQALELSQLTSLFEIFPSLQEAEKKYGHAVN